MPVLWRVSDRADPVAVIIADRHYNRQKPGTPQFSPPGKLIVLLGTQGVALWTSTYQIHADHQWKDSWVNTLFRNEGAGLSSELIRQAVAATRYKWGDPPSGGMITFVDANKIRKKRDPGRCYRKDGFQVVGETKVNKLIVFQLLPSEMPDPAPAVDQTLHLFSDD